MTLGDLTVHFCTEDAAAALLADSSIRVADLPAEADLFEGLASALRFPDYFGRNWDAVDECLRDVEAGEMTVLLVHDAAKRWERNPKTMATLVDIWASAAAERNADLHLVFVW
jgi:RNAse (barnase) inhibitor barstar